MTEHTDTPEVIDVQHVTCGLVPLIQTHLEGSEPEVDVLAFKVRQGIETELWNSFGTGGKWLLTDVRKELFYDLVTFHRREISELDPLGLMEF
ncbi:hypothetical protein GM415_01160 [Pseudodesulfovibrio cashew]|uniref:Uncharacterized protein n=1 Tax=Pseudodesulfovibrio cashew TaxID=2678688 RepID=A0A6I6JEF6_9BACT|nr:hypothetical protein [Pseudodesulfovibrio cashew]QGY38802.1 hypothetical protein GM415_01160 [Pseudodesulfovibrio cashew]